MSKATQSDRLLQWLLSVGPINPLEAWTELGIYRLGARIFDLKKQGMTIQRKLVKVRNQFGEPCGPVAQYRLLVPEAPAHG